MNKLILVFINLSTKYPKRVLSGWTLLLVTILPIALSIGSSFNTQYDLPNSPSKIAVELLAKNLPSNAQADLTMVIEGKDNLISQSSKVDKLIEELQKIQGVGKISSPFTTPGSLSVDGKIALAQVYLIKNKYTKNTILKLEENSTNSNSFTINFTGEALKKTTGTKPGISEILAISAALVVLLFTFGSLVAALLPIVTAVVALGVSTGLVIFLSHNFSIPEFAPMLADLVGLGVGLDYALFIVSRFRKELPTQSPTQAIGIALKTSGKAVLFAGSIVCVALLGLFSVHVKFLYGVALSASISVVVTMLASLSLLPSLLKILGEKVNKGSVLRKKNMKNSNFWHFWSAHIAKKPKLLALLSLVILLLLCLPTSKITLGSADPSSDAKNSTSYKAYTAMSKGFGAGYSSPLELVVKTSPTSEKTLRDLTSLLKKEPAISQLSPVFISPNNKISIVNFTLKYNPQNPKSNAFIAKLRDRIIPKATLGSKDDVLVGGISAVLLDFSTSLTQKLPGFILVVVLLSSILLMLLFRSLLIPIKAAIMNLISILAAFGVVVISFQWGLITPLLNIGAGPIEPFLPIILFAILFGLSMDYEVFLVSRIQEEWLLSKDNKKAVKLGLADTGGVITAAALIMIVVFTAFIFTGDRTIQLFGVGLASAIFIDATVIRSVLVPALMQTFGDKNWYLPKWLDRILPKVHLEDLE